MVSVHAVLLRQTAEGCDVVVVGEVVLARALLVDVPENVQTDGVHARRLAHLDAVLPVGAWNARVVHLGGFDDEGLTI